MGMLASPVVAQKDKFGEIECGSLKIVDGGAVTVWSKDGLSSMLDVEGVFTRKGE